MHRPPLLALALALAACDSGSSDGSISTSDSSTGEGTTLLASQTSEPDTTAAETGSSSTGDSDGGTSSSTTGPDTTGTTDASSTGTSDASSSTTGDPVDLCGDGKVDQGEACDNGPETLLCDSDCTPVACGDAHINEAAGEECDDGNVDETDGCRSSCLLPKCGDGMLDDGETCDDGNAVAGDGCDNDCTPSWWEHVGVAYDVPIADLKGWTLCWEGQGGDSLIDGVKACAGQHLLAACAPQLEQVTLTMAAHGPKAEVTTPSSIFALHVVNGAQWAYGASNFGFSAPGVDMNTEGPLLLWGMVQYDLNGLSKCEDFNAPKTSFRRLLFTR